MSFSSDAKREIVDNKPMRLRHKLEQGYGLLLYARRFDPEEMSLHTELEEVAGLYGWFVQGFAGRQAQVRVREQSRSGKRLFHLDLPRREDRERVLDRLGHRDGAFNEALVREPEQLGAFLSGAWLACGGITDPQKNYHLEFLCRDPAKTAWLRELLARCTKGAGHAVRRGADVLYFKECVEIEDLLALMGASKSSLAMIEIEIIKGVRNKANRVTNCETANIDKLVSASASQVEDIQLILDQKGADWLPTGLRQIALHRLDNPDMSLRELSETSPVPLSRSGMHHRLSKLSRLAAELRQPRED